MARKDGRDRGLFERPKDSGIWWIRYADATGKQRREKAGMKRVALALYNKRKRETREGILLPDRKKKLTFREITERAIERAKKQNASWESDAGRARDLVKTFGERPAESISPRELEKWMDDIQAERELAPATINKYRALLSSIYTQAMRNEDVTKNPAKLTQFRPQNNTRVRFLSEEEQTSLYAVLSPEHRIEVDFALHTGVRRTNQFDLEWAHVDLEKGFAFFAHTKNGKAQYVYFNSYLWEVLRNLERERTQRVEAGEEADEFVFGESHRELCRNNQLGWWYKALAASGLENFRWHDLRHTFASRLAMKGHGMRTLQEALHHQSPTMTLRYAHLSDTHMRTALEDLVVPVSVSVKVQESGPDGCGQKETPIEIGVELSTVVSSSPLLVSNS